MKHQDCSKRSMVYETWCTDCEEKAKKEIGEKNDISEDEKKTLNDDIKLFKYLAGSASSTYERGMEHAQARDQINTTSHKMKHIVQEREGELDNHTN